MRLPLSRFRLRTLMIAVAVTALGLAALANPLSRVWASAVFTLTLLILLAATLGSLVHRDRSWIGFACFGWAFLFLAFGPWRRSDATPIPTPLTTILLKEASVRLALEEGMLGGTTVDLPNDAQAIGRFAGGGPSIPYTFLQTGNSLLSLAMGCVGSVLARYSSISDPTPSG